MSTENENKSFCWTVAGFCPKNAINEMIMRKIMVRPNIKRKTNLKFDPTVFIPDSGVMFIYL